MYLKHNYFSHIKILCSNQASQQKHRKFSDLRNVATRKIPHGDFEKLACMRILPNHFLFGSTLAILPEESRD